MSNQAGVADVFVEGLDSALWHFSTGTGKWDLVGGKITGVPSPVASVASSPLDVFVEGIDHAVWHATYNGTSWSWENVGGYTTAPPTAVSWSPGRFDVFVRGGDGALWHRWYQ